MSSAAQTSAAPHAPYPRAWKGPCARMRVVFPLDEQQLRQGLVLLRGGRHHHRIYR